MRRPSLLLSVLLACTVNKGDTGDDGGTTFGDETPFTSTVGMSSEPPLTTSTSDPSMPTSDPSMPTSEPDSSSSATLPPGDDLPQGSSSGDYLLAVSTVISKDLPLQFYTTVEATSPSLWTLTLQPLSLDIGEVNQPQEPVGDPFVFTDVPVVDGKFTLDFGELMISGAANPITGSDITASIVLAAQVESADFFCGDASGMVTSPLMTSIDGSTFAAVRVAGLDALPVEITINCAGDTVTGM